MIFIGVVVLFDLVCWGKTESESDNQFRYKRTKPNHIRIKIKSKQPGYVELKPKQTKTANPIWFGLT